jgi:hypothetical protein
MIRNPFRSSSGGRAKESAMENIKRLHAIIVRREFAEELARKVEAGLPPDCDHRNNRKSCPACSERRTTVAIAGMIRASAGGNRNG